MLNELGTTPWRSMGGVWIDSQNYAKCVRRNLAVLTCTNICILLRTEAHYRQVKVKEYDLVISVASCIDRATGGPHADTECIYRQSSFHCASQVLSFYKLKVCGKPASSRSIGTTFPTACPRFVSLSHILVILAIFQTFSLLIYLLWLSVISDLWC
jgi:hypothetical protein